MNQPLIQAQPVELYVYPITVERIYCGPAALMSISGVEKRDVTAWINEAKGRRHNVGVIGTSYAELEHGIKKAGFNFIRTDLECSNSNHVSVEKFALGNPTGLFILCAGNHYLTLGGGLIQDIHARFGAPPHEHKYRQKWVKKAWRILPPGGQP
jgi:hypothetical protein